MNNLLLIIDLQKDFINDYTKALPEKINKLLEKNQYKNIILTEFINSENTRLVKDLNYKGCLTEDGKSIVIDNVSDYKIIKKNTYTAYSQELIDYINQNKIEKIYLCGIDTDACVLKTALDLFENNYNVYVLKDLCASSGGIKYHNNAIEILERNIGKKYII